jgi:hypothetical protein
MKTFNSSMQPPKGGRMRSRQVNTLLILLFFVGLTVYLLRTPHHAPPPFDDPPPAHEPHHENKPLITKPLSPSTAKSHPVYQLMSSAQKQFDSVTSRQSKTLEEAVAEYKRRYNVAPPPNFDKWYEFAKNKGVQLIDEYDTIYHSLLPFWAIDPKTLRERARESLGFDNAMMAVLIRNGKVVKVDRGPEWQQKATQGMMKEFLKYLPDMDLVFNLHDEPRVIVPDGDLSRLVSLARTQMDQSTGQANNWSPRPEDMNDGKSIEEYKITRFNRFAHQPTWTNSRQSCSPDSPARSLDENPSDNYTAYALGDLGFIYNQTAFSDICNSPSLAKSFGFFDRPNAFDIVHDLFPVFSQSKISSFQDILYPSPWYWDGKVTYNSRKDYDWDKKEDKMYWRGSTTGGFSRAGGWRRQHRQLFVKKINALNKAQILEPAGAEGAQEYAVKEVDRQEYKSSFDVKMTFIGQCDPGDCEDQRRFFEVVQPAGQQDAWAYKYLVDIDGNAFSGRYYAFLQSKSLVYKLALFREWHDEWLKPWVHYVPLSLRGDEYVESVRYFAYEEEGRLNGPRLAMQGKEWAEKVLRNEDLEVWFFRLLLE